MPETMLQAGRVLDAKIGALLGWTLIISSFRTGSVKVGRKVMPTIHVTENPDEQEWSGVPPGESYSAELPHFSTDIAAAWDVVERMMAKAWYPRLAFEEGRWTCDLLNARFVGYWGEGDTAPLAICRAALAARPVETEAAHA